MDKKNLKKGGEGNLNLNDFYVNFTHFVLHFLKGKRS